SIETRDVFVAFSAAGAPSADARSQRITQKLPQQSFLALAVRPGGARVIWQESRDDISPAAHALTADVGASSPGEATDLGLTGGTVAAWNGMDTLLIWRDDIGRRIVGQRLGR